MYASQIMSEFIAAGIFDWLIDCSIDFISKNIKNTTLHNVNLCALCKHNGYLSKIFCTVQGIDLVYHLNLYFCSNIRWHDALRKASQAEVEMVGLYMFLLFIRILFKVGAKNCWRQKVTLALIKRCHACVTHGDWLRGRRMCPLKNLAF